jgi:glutathione S-transferase
MSWCSGGIHPFLARINSPSKVCDVAGTEESVKKLAAANLMELFKIADDLLAGRDCFFDHFTAPDAHFFWCQRRPRQFEIDLSGFRHCVAHFERMQKRPSVQRYWHSRNLYRTTLPRLLDQFELRATKIRCHLSRTGISEATLFCSQI